MTDLDELFRLAPPPEPPPPPVDWDAARAALGVELPEDYKALAEAYGYGSLGGLHLWIPGHANPDGDLLRQVEPQRDTLRYLIDRDHELPYAPEQLLPWGRDEFGNSAWWLLEAGMPVVVDEGRGEDWDRYESAVAMLTGLLSGRVTSDFMVLEGGFEPYG